MDHKRRESTRHSHSRIQKGSQTKWAQKMETEKRMEITTNERRGTDKQTNKKHTEFPERSIIREYRSERERECVLFYFKSHFSHCVHSNLRMFTDSTIHQMHFIQSMKIQFIYGNGGWDTQIYTPGDRGNALTSRNWRKRKSGGDSDREPLTDTFGHNNYECVHSLYYKAKGTFYNLL